MGVCASRNATRFDGDYRRASQPISQPQEAPSALSWPPGGLAILARVVAVRGLNQLSASALQSALPSYVLISEDAVPVTAEGLSLKIQDAIRDIGSDDRPGDEDDIHIYLPSHQSELQINGMASKHPVVLQVTKVSREWMEWVEGSRSTASGSHAWSIHAAAAWLRMTLGSGRSGGMSGGEGIGGVGDTVTSTAKVVCEVSRGLKDCVTGHGSWAMDLGGHKGEQVLDCSGHDDLSCHDQNITMTTIFQ